jgi:hypothetical protein
MIRPLAYITGDFGGNELDAKAEAAKYCRAVYEAGYSPICPVLFQPYFLKPKKAQEYKDGRDMANELLRRSRILVVCGDAESDEVLADIALAKHLRIASTTLDGILTIDKKHSKKK